MCKNLMYTVTYKLNTVTYKHGYYKNVARGCRNPPSLHSYAPAEFVSLRLLIVVALVGVPRSPRPPRPARVGCCLRLRRPCPFALGGACRAVAWGRQARGPHHAASTFPGGDSPRAAAQELAERGAEVEADR